MAPTVLCASGSNAHGQLANGTLDDSHTFGACIFSGVSKPGMLPVGTHHIWNVASGGNHTLVILERVDDVGQTHSELWGCGDGAKGQLGPTYDSQSGKAIFRPIELPLHEYGYHGYTPRLVTAAWETTYVVFSCPGKDDILTSMGANDFGDLGVGGMGKGKQALKPLHIVKFDTLTPPGTTKLVVMSLAAGPHHVIVHLNSTLEDGSTRSSDVGWGASRHGQLGKATDAAGRALSSQALPRELNIPTEDAVVASALGNQHSVLLHASGRISCFGSDRKGQLRGIGGVEDVRTLGCTWHGTYLVVETDGAARVLSVGSHSRGQLGRDVTNANDATNAAPVQFPFTSTTGRLLGIVCGSEHVLSLIASGPSADPKHDAGAEVWGWGWNEHGNLGLGMTDDIVLPTKIWPDLTRSETIRGRAIGIWAGCGTSWIAIE